MRIEKSIDKVVNTIPKIVLHEIDFKILEEVELLFAINDTLHLYIASYAYPY